MKDDRRLSLYTHGYTRDMTPNQRKRYIKKRRRNVHAMIHG